MGWRNQIPMLLELGFRVICPDLMGFGGTVSNLKAHFFGVERSSDRSGCSAGSPGVAKPL